MQETSFEKPKHEKINIPLHHIFLWFHAHLSRPSTTPLMLPSPFMVLQALCSHITHTLTTNFFIFPCLCDAKLCQIRNLHHPRDDNRMINHILTTIRISIKALIQRTIRLSSSCMSVFRVHLCFACEFCLVGVCAAGCGDGLVAGCCEGKEGKEREQDVEGEHFGGGNR
ncbi:hypothetical protein BGZ60DRAFT_53808 [Tricladium varicosporioides]|nr:hypothetical protein BGZ60DRAFT_53808 [Hymenoscyphus varicosporioides]